MALNWKLHDDRQKVTISDIGFELELDAEGVEDVLRHLGEFRALMQPPVVIEWAPGTKAEAIPNPGWRTEYDAMLEHPVVHLRDPRLGWLHYLLPHHEAKALGESLVKLGSLPPPAAPPKQNQN